MRCDIALLGANPTCRFVRRPFRHCWPGLATPGLKTHLADRTARGLQRYQSRLSETWTACKPGACMQHFPIVHVCVCKGAQKIYRLHATRAASVKTLQRCAHGPKLHACAQHATRAVGSRGAISSAAAAPKRVHCITRCCSAADLRRVARPSTRLNGGSTRSHKGVPRGPKTRKTDHGQQQPPPTTTCNERPRGRQCKRRHVCSAGAPAPSHGTHRGGVPRRMLPPLVGRHAGR